MKLNFEFKEEEVYDEKANVTYSRLSENNREILAPVDEKIKEIARLLDIIVDVHTFDDKELTNLNQLGGNETDYVRNCRRIWNRLWKYFGVDDYKEKCFLPEEKGLLLTPSEKKFLQELFVDASFLDGRAKNLDDVEKEKIQWAATNLYQIMERRISVTDDVQEKFYKVTADKTDTRERMFSEISSYIEKARKLAFDDSEDYCLSIKEKEIWAVNLAKEIKETVQKWNDILATMDSLKFNDEDTYQGVIRPERLLEDAIKKEKE